MEPTPPPEVVRVKDPRLPEIAWLVVIGVLIAAAGPVLFHALALNRLAGSLVLVAAVVLAALAIRRAYDPHSPTVRSDVTRQIAYCVAAVLGLTAVAGKQHWAIGSCIAAAEIAIVFDVITIVARPRAAGER